MPIEVTCICGRALNLRDELAGKTVRCPECKGNLQVPIPVGEVVEEVSAGPPPLRRMHGESGSAVAAGPPPLPQAKVDQIDAEPPPVTPDTDRGSRKPKKSKKKKNSVYQQYYGGTKEDPILALNEGWFGNINGGIWGGLFTLFCGILFLVLLIVFGRIGIWFIFALLMIAVGLGAIIKGLMELY